MEADCLIEVEAGYLIDVGEITVLMTKIKNN